MIDNNTVNVSPELIAREWGNHRAELSLVKPVHGIAATIAEQGAPEIDAGELLLVPVRIISDKFAPNWAISDDECGQMAKALAGIMDHYFPSVLDQGGPIVGAALVFLTVAGSRMALGVPRYEPEEKKPAPMPVSEAANDEN